MIQLLANKLGKKRAWAPVTHVGDMDEVSATGFGLAQP